MKRNALVFGLLAIAMGAMAQGKISPQAQISIARHQAKAVRAAARTHTAGLQSAEEKGLTLVVTTDGEPTSQTVSSLRAVGAQVLSRLGRQTVVSVPADSVASLARIQGLKRIDSGHRGRLKTDVTRRETGVSLLNGPTVADGAVTYTGRGVNVIMIDAGFDFQHAAFKDAEGRSRIKCVYLMGDEGGRKFTVSDPALGDYTFPGSVYDTPELIAQLTTDMAGEYHGSHTAAIAAGSIAPQGFGGMAPEADLVLIPLNEVKVEGLDEDDEDGYVELALAFAAAYADQSEQPTVLSASMNSHGGPHDGTSTVTQAIESVAEHLVPVFSAGNEGGYPIHLYQKFTSTKKSIKTLLGAMAEDETGKYVFNVMAGVNGYTRPGTTPGEVGVQLSLMTVNYMMGRLQQVWSSDACTTTLGGETSMQMISSDDNTTLAKYFEGDIALSAADNGDGRLALSAEVYGGCKSTCFFMLTVTGTDGTEIDLWDELYGFIGTKDLGLSGYADGDSDMSAGDWTSTSSVISVGAYCTNTTLREYNGDMTDTSVPEDEDGYADVMDDIAFFSSFGTSFNGVSQPTICAPGVNIVSAISSYAVDDPEEVDAEMQWQGSPYAAESGTSMSCPVVSGIVALWLQADPTLTLEGVKTVMRESAVSDEFTAADDIRWGFGKINAKRGIDYIKSQTEGFRGVRSVNHADATVYDLQGRPVSSVRMAPGLYIYKGKKILK